MYHFIINPASRSGKGAKYWSKLEPYLISRRISYISHVSKHSGHILQIMQELTAGLTDDSPSLSLVVLGGDGTINEVLQGITRFDKIRLSYIPTGSSNDFARDLGLSKDPVLAMQKIIDHPTSHKTDIGLIEYKDCNTEDPAATEWKARRFIGSCGIGYDAAVCDKVMHSRLKKILNRIGLGKLVYLTIALKELLRASSIDAELIIHDTQQSIPIHNLLFLAGLNHRYEGGGFMFSPAAVDNDGILDLCCASNATTLRVLRILPTAFSGNHIRFQEVDDYHVASYTVRTQAPMHLHTDGEPLGMTDRIKVTCLDKILELIY